MSLLKLHFLTLALLASVLCTAQLTLVYDAETGAPIEGATFMSNNPLRLAETNAKGEVELGKFKDLERIQIFAHGYGQLLLSYADIAARKFEIALVPVQFNMGEVIVSASKFRESSSASSQQVAVINPKEVALQNPQTAADLLGQSGKVFIQKSQQGGGSPMIRGFATNRLLYSVDGVRMNTAIFRGGNIQNVISLDPFAIQTTEVLLGPGAVVYGSDAIGGVMFFKTLHPQLSLSDEPLITGKAVARYSSANSERTGHFDINVGFEKWGFLTSFSQFDFGHLRQGRFGPDDYLKDYYVLRLDSVDRVQQQEDPLLQIPSGYRQTNLMQKVLYQPKEYLELEYGFHYSETSPYGRYDRHNRLRNGAPRYARWDYGPQIWTMHKIDILLDKRTWFWDDISLRAAAQNFQESRISRNFNDPIENTQAENVDAYSLNLDVKKKLGQKNTLYYGAEFVENQVRSRGSDLDISTDQQSPAAPRYPNANWQSLGYYIQDKQYLSENSLLNLGLRYNMYRLAADFATDFYNLPFSSARSQNAAFSGSLGLLIRLSPKLKWQTNLASAFRAPNVDDIGKVFDSEPGAVTVPNPALRAEYAYTADMGFTYEVNGKLEVYTTAFYTYLDRALVRRAFSLNGQDSILYQGELSQVQAIQNAAYAQVYGLQFGWEWAIGKRWSWETDLNWQAGLEEMDNGEVSTSRHAAPFFGISRLGFQYRRLQLEGNIQFQGERSFDQLAEEERGKTEIYALDVNGNPYAPAWYTLNFKALYALNTNLSISAGIENLSDQRYRPYSSGLSGAGRNFVLALRANF